MRLKRPQAETARVLKSVKTLQRTIHRRCFRCKLCVKSLEYQL